MNMAARVFDDKISKLLAIAEQIQTFFTGGTEYEALYKIIRATAAQHKAVIAENKIASDDYPFMVIAANPDDFLHDIVAEVKRLHTDKYKELLNPTIVATKLIEQEYMLDMNGVRVCYTLKSAIASNYLMKAIACQRLAEVGRFYDFVESETNILDMTKLSELEPEYDYSTESKRVIGGRKKKRMVSEKKRGNSRTTIIGGLMEYVRNHPEISEGIIFINDLADCNHTAMDIIFTNYKYKDAIAEYLGSVVKKEYSDKYTFKAFLHADFRVPYDFRMKKHSCLINDRKTKIPTYLANLYNIGMYSPVPCVKSIIKDSYIHMAHPLVKLRMLYIDMYMIERRTNAANPQAYEKLYINGLRKQFDQLRTYDKSPMWVGFYQSEQYDKNKYNMAMKLSAPYEMILI